MSAPAYPLDHAKGYAPVPRDLLALEPVIRNAVALAIYTILSLRARHAPAQALGSHGPVTLERGQCLCGELELANQLRQPKTTIRRALKVLVDCGLVARKADHRGSVVTVREYGTFGQAVATGGPAADQRRTSGGAAPDPNKEEIRRSGDLENTDPSVSGKKRKPAASPEPLPFTIKALLEAFKRGAQSRFNEEFDPKLAKPLTDLIRRLHAGGKTLADVEAAGRLVSTWTHPVGVAWMARDGSLWDAIAKASSSAKPSGRVLSLPLMGERR